MTKLCKGECGLELETTAFSVNPHTYDRLNPKCNKCAAAYQKELRLLRHEQTLMRNGAGYLERHQAKREQEAAYLSGTQRPSPTEDEVLCSMNPNSFVGLVDSFLRLPSQSRVKYWKAC